MILFLILFLLQAGGTATVGGHSSFGRSTGGGGTPVVCGNSNTASGSNGGNSGIALGANACVPAAPATVQSCVLDFSNNTAGRHFECAVYANSGTAPTGSPLCSSATTAAVGPGEITATLSGCGTLSAGSTYWIVVNTDTAGDYTTVGTMTATHGAFAVSTYGTWPSGGWTGNDGAGNAQSVRVYLNTLQ